MRPVVDTTALTSRYLPSGGRRPGTAGVARREGPETCFENLTQTSRSQPIGDILPAVGAADGARDYGVSSVELDIMTPDTGSLTATMTRCLRLRNVSVVS